MARGLLAAQGPAPGRAGPKPRPAGLPRCIAYQRYNAGHTACGCAIYAGVCEQNFWRLSHGQLSARVCIFSKLSAESVAIVGDCGGRRDDPAAAMAGRRGDVAGTLW
jgi:hypothetical protein